MAMADDVLTTRHLSSRQALEGCGFPTVSTDDMEAEAIPAQLPAEEVLAAAYFAWVQTTKLDAMKRVGL